MKHTPGPWKWYWRKEDGEANCGVFSEKNPGQAYAVARCPRYQKKEQWEVDARLIAAAPDLLAALKWYVTGKGKPDLDGSIGRAAISKARGD